MDTLQYRAYEDRDKEDLLELWGSDSGWGAITPQQFDNWYINNPSGKSIIVVAAGNDEKIVGQVVFSPSTVELTGTPIRALRASAPILAATFRQSSLRNAKHPALALLKCGLETAQRAGYKYIYSFPAASWIPVLTAFSKTLPYATDDALYKCFSLSLEGSALFPEEDASYIVRVAEGIHSEYEDLWRDAVVAFPITCGITRSTDWLRWSLCGHLVLEVRSRYDKQLTGYMAVKKDSGLIIDVLARNGSDLRVVFSQCLRVLQGNDLHLLPASVSRLKGMLTPTMETAIAAIDYQQDPYTFAFTGCLLDPTLSFEQLKASHWYMTPLG